MVSPAGSLPVDDTARKDATRNVRDPAMAATSLPSGGRRWGAMAPSEAPSKVP